MINLVEARETVARLPADVVGPNDVSKYVAFLFRRYTGNGIARPRVTEAPGCTLWDFGIHRVSGRVVRVEFRWKPLLDPRLVWVHFVPQ